MAHFAELDNDNVVLRVVVVANNELLDENNVEQEQKGINFCVNLFGGNWVQTSYNNNFRKIYAAIGYTYDADKDIFITPKPYPSWIFDNNTQDWIAPIPYPVNDDKNAVHFWNEESLEWVLFIDNSK